MISRDLLMLLEESQAYDFPHVLTGAGHVFSLNIHMMRSGRHRQTMCQRGFDRREIPNNVLF